MGSRGRRTSACALAVAAAIGLAACGDDDSTTSASEDETTTETASAETVTVTATEYDFALDPGTPTTETKTIEFVNDGKDPHALIYARINEGFTLDEAYELQGRKGSAEMLGEVDAGPGKSGTLKVRGPVEPGDGYVLLCPIGGPEGLHYKLGQLEEFSIE